MKIACVSYRDWAHAIYDRLAATTEHNYLIIRSFKDYDEKKILDFKPDLILYYGWSWKVSTKILSAHRAIMLHPAPLPKYRGGSPIQNQIIRGEKVTQVTLFLMNERMDAGDIIAQKEISLEGHLNEVFSRITEAGSELTSKILRDGYTPRPQDESQASEFKRRTPDESEITIDELKEQSAEYLYNKVRMLEDPYPNAFIRTKDGRKLLLKRVELD